MVNKYWIILMFILLIPIVLAERFELNLYSGWNLISIPFSSYSIISDNCENKKIYYYDNSLQQFKNADIHHLESLKGYWMYVKDSCKIVFEGEPFYTFSNLILESGWNLIGSPYGKVPISILKNICPISKIYSYNSLKKEFFVPENFESGNGYWIYSNRQCKYEKLLTQVEKSCDITEKCILKVGKSCDRLERDLEDKVYYGECLYILCYPSEKSLELSFKIIYPNGKELPASCNSIAQPGGCGISFVFTTDKPAGKYKIEYSSPGDSCNVRIKEFLLEAENCGNEEQSCCSNNRCNEGLICLNNKCIKPFKILLDPSQLQINLGSSANVKVLILSSLSSQLNVRRVYLSCSNLEGFSCNFNPNPCDLKGEICISTLTLSVSKNVLPSNYQIKVIGKSDSIIEESLLSVKVIQPEECKLTKIELKNSRQLDSNVKCGNEARFELQFAAEFSNCKKGIKICTYDKCCDILSSGEQCSITISRVLTSKQILVSLNVYDRSNYYNIGSKDFIVSAQCSQFECSKNEDCNDNNPCTKDICNEGNCEHQINIEKIGKFCGENKVCSSKGECVPCGNLNQPCCEGNCKEGICESGMCIPKEQCQVTIEIGEFLTSKRQLICKEKINFEFYVIVKSCQLPRKVTAKIEGKTDEINCKENPDPELLRRQTMAYLCQINDVQIDSSQQLKFIVTAHIGNELYTSSKTYRVECQQPQCKKELEDCNSDNDCCQGLKCIYSIILQKRCVNPDRFSCSGKVLLYKGERFAYCNYCCENKNVCGISACCVNSQEQCPPVQCGGENQVCCENNRCDEGLVCRNNKCVRQERLQCQEGETDCRNGEFFICKNNNWQKVEIPRDLTGTDYSFDFISNYIKCRGPNYAGAYYKLLNVKKSEFSTQDENIYVGLEGKIDIYCFEIFESGEQPKKYIEVSACKGSSEKIDGEVGGERISREKGFSEKWNNEIFRAYQFSEFRATIDLGKFAAKNDVKIIAIKCAKRSLNTNIIYARELQSPSEELKSLFSLSFDKDEILIDENGKIVNGNLVLKVLYSYDVFAQTFKSVRGKNSIIVNNKEQTIYVSSPQEIQISTLAEEANSILLKFSGVYYKGKFIVRGRGNIERCFEEVQIFPNDVDVHKLEKSIRRIIDNVNENKIRGEIKVVQVPIINSHWLHGKIEFIENTILKKDWKIKFIYYLQGKAVSESQYQFSPYIPGIGKEISLCEDYKSFWYCKRGTVIETDYYSEYLTYEVSDKVEMYFFNPAKNIQIKVGELVNNNPKRCEIMHLIVWYNKKGVDIRVIGNGCGRSKDEYNIALIDGGNQIKGSVTGFIEREGEIEIHVSFGNSIVCGKQIVVIPCSGCDILKQTIKINDDCSIQTLNLLNSIYSSLPASEETKIVENKELKFGLVSLKHKYTSEIAFSALIKENENIKLDFRNVKPGIYKLKICDISQEVPVCSEKEVPIYPPYKEIEKSKGWHLCYVPIEIAEYYAKESNINSIWYYTQEGNWITYNKQLDKWYKYEPEDKTSRKKEITFEEAKNYVKDFGAWIFLNTNAKIKAFESKEDFVDIKANEWKIVYIEDLTKISIEKEANVKIYWYENDKWYLFIPLQNKLYQYTYDKLRKSWEKEEIDISKLKEIQPLCKTYFINSDKDTKIYLR